MKLRSSFVGSLILLTSFMAISCTKDAAEAGGERSIKLEEEWTISGTGDESEILGMIAYPQIDNEGNIYVIDPTSWRLRSWNKEGEYRWSAGSTGSGPGEIGAIASMYVQDDSLRLFDAVNAAIHTFDLSGDQYGSVYLEEPVELFGISPLTEKTALIPNLQIEDTVATILHTLDLKEGGIVSDFGDPDRIRISEDPEEMNIIFSSVRSAVTGDRLIVTPSVYNGKLGIFEEQEGEWTYAGDWSGYASVDPAYSIERKSAEEEYDKPYHSGRINDDFTQYLYITYRSYSMGLYPQDDGTLLHISLRNIGEAMEVVFEQFNGETGDLMRYGLSTALNIPFAFNNYGLLADRKGNIYLSDNQNVRLKKFTLNWRD